MKRRSSLKRASLQGPQFLRAGRHNDFGGGTARGNARHARGFKAAAWMHLCLRSEQAKGPRGLRQPRNFLTVQRVLDQARKKHHIEIADFINAGTHLHLRVKASRRKDLQNFLRVITTLIARNVTGARKGHAFGRFWDGICYSRVLRGQEEGLLRLLKSVRLHAGQGLEAQRDWLRAFASWVDDARRLRRLSPRHPRPDFQPYIYL